MIRIFILILLCALLVGCVYIEKRTVWLTYEEAMRECPRCLGGMKAVLGD